MTKIKVKRLKRGLQVIRFILQKLCLSEFLCYDPCESTQWISASHSLFSSAPSFLPWNHELLLLHIPAAKASCCTANSHCPLTGMLEMKKQTHKHTKK